MIKYAQKHNTAANVEFMLIEKDKRLTEISNQKFDYSILKMVIHEMPEAERMQIITKAKEVSNALIIAEWLAPQPKNMDGKITWFVELIAGKMHFNNFRQWYITGGIDGFLDRHGLAIVQEELFINKTGKIVSLHW
jgi:hypothetical protein